MYDHNASPRTVLIEAHSNDIVILLSTVRTRSSTCIRINKTKKERKASPRVNINEKYLSKNSNRKENIESILSIFWNYVNHLASSGIATIAAILRIYAQEIEYYDRSYSHQSSHHDCPKLVPPMSTQFKYERGENSSLVSFGDEIRGTDRVA